jgi:hypothetical protein
VRNRRERVPVERVTVRECPDDPGQRQTAGHHRIAVNVSLIVEVNEVVSERLPEDNPDERNKETAN